MKTRVKPFGLLAAAGLFLSTFIGPTAHAQTIVQGNTYLMDSAQVSSLSEQIQVFYSVILQASGLYEYSFNLLNPAGDVELPGAPNPGAPQYVGSFQLSFDATVPGAYLFGSAPVGGTLQNNGNLGLTWTFPAVAPGSYSPPLVFDSSLAPGIGSASASGGAIPPGPWTGISDISVPHASPEPGTTALLVLGGTFFAPRIRRFFARS